MALVANRRNAALSAAAALGYAANQYRRLPPRVQQDIREAAVAMARRTGQFARQQADRMYRAMSRRARGYPNRALSYPRVPPGGLSLLTRYGGKTSRAVARKRFKRRFKKRFSKRKRSSFLGKIWRALCTPMVYKSTIAQAYGGTQGLRSWKAVELAGENILTTLGNKHPSNFLFNTSVGTSTVTLQDPGGSNFTLCIDKFIWDTRIQNRSNASMELKIYECVVRNDIATSQIGTGATDVLGLFSASVDNGTGFFVGQNMSNLAPNQVAFPTGVSHHWQHPAFTPFMSNEFCTFFKVKKVHSRVLTPNEVWPMKFYLPKKSVKGSHIFSSSSYEWEKGWSKVLLFSWVGQPVDDNSVNNQTKAKIDLFIQADITVKYHFTPGDEHLVNLAYGNDINSIGQQYQFNPSGFVAVVPASEVIETVVQPADTVPNAAP